MSNELINELKKFMQFVDKFVGENEEKLLGCPFCGIVPNITIYPDSESTEIRCHGPDCKVCISTKGYKPKQEAIQIWNTRK